MGAGRKYLPRDKLGLLFPRLPDPPPQYPLPRRRGQDAVCTLAQLDRNTNAAHPRFFDRELSERRRLYHCSGSAPPLLRQRHHFQITMARVELPESRLRLRKRRRRVRITIVLAAGILLLLSGAVGLAYLPALQISAVQVEGAQTVSSSAVEAFVRERLEGSYAYTLPKTNIFLYPKRSIARALVAAYPQFASVDVHAVDFHTIAVEIVEREPRALWCWDHCYLMDENGVVYGEAPVFSAPVYTTYQGTTTLLRQGSAGQAGERLPKQFLAPGEVLPLSALVDAIMQKIPDERLQEAGVDTQSDVQMYFVGGFIVRFALRDEGGDVFERFTLALSSAPFKDKPLSGFEYLDLRFGDKLYYKEK